MKFLVNVLLLIFLLRSFRKVECAVGLYGPDRYEGLAESCLLPMDFGYCRAKIQRYYFDIRRMKCNMFYWGGCAGNDNNFKSMEQCNEFCAAGASYQEINSIVPLKRERVVNDIAANDYNSIPNTPVVRGGNSNSKPSAPKFTVKPVQSLRNNSSASTLKASPKSLNVNSKLTQQKYSKPTLDKEYEDEEYED